MYIQGCNVPEQAGKKPVERGNSKGEHSQWQKVQVKEQFARHRKRKRRLASGRCSGTGKTRGKAVPIIAEGWQVEGGYHQQVHWEFRVIEGT